MNTRPIVAFDPSLCCWGYCGWTFEGGLFGGAIPTSREVRHGGVTSASDDIRRADQICRELRAAISREPQGEEWPGDDGWEVWAELLAGTQRARSAIGAGVVFGVLGALWPGATLVPARSAKQALTGGPHAQKPAMVAAARGYAAIARIIDSQRNRDCREAVADAFGVLLAGRPGIVGRERGPRAPITGPLGHGGC